MSDHEPMRVLHVIDEVPASAGRTEPFLDRDAVDVTIATSATEGLERLAEGGIDRVVCGHESSKPDGLAFREAVREEHPDLPFVLVTGRDSEAIAGEFVAATGHRRLQRGVETPHDKIEALHAVATRFASCRTSEGVHELTIDAAERILDLHLCYVGIVEGETIVPKARSAHAGPEYVRAMGIDEGLAGKTVRTGESLLVENVEEAVDAEPVKGNYRSAISIPIGSRGVFQAVSEQTSGFDETDLELAELLVTHAAATLDRQTHERELERQNERLSEFASVISHDLRGPLTVANGSLELARETDGEEHLGRVEQALDRIEELVDDVLALARQGRTIGETAPVALGPAADWAWSNVETGEAELRTEADLTVDADEERLEALFENLFRNAVEHGSMNPPSQAQKDTVEHSSTSSRPEAGDAVERAGENVTVRLGDSPAGFFV